ncbi:MULTISPECIES: histidine phosphatase family protein [unclassified Duganella]|uniref:histidine phosphatase family protein n=1 Tax=unclassified Duganella TaxID=2636909 RepID=UPI000E348CC0|nr:MULTISPECIES: histidine phosphatase family protein [unclassified Duganella]RFP10690.1 histidine phosphatase family protein [Duganella sp. BJB475]RFP27283.1 histidine phosphatase family protein [Duganella sp. BJB476]
MKNTTILLIRHGETSWNAVRRLQGHTDIPLNEEGARQAGALAQALAAEQVDVLVSSDLQRAMQTAQAVADQYDGLEVQTDDQLRERCYGVFEGMLYAEIEQQYPAEYALWQARDIDAVMPPGVREAESFRQFYQRSTDGIAEWAQRHPGRTIAIVAHGGVLECAYREAVGMSLDSPRDFQVKNASINRFTWADGKLALTSWGEVDHLSLAAMDDII